MSDLPPPTPVPHEHVARLFAADEATVTIRRRLLDALIDDSECRFDHHGDCQEHGYSLEPGEVCPQHEAKQVIAAARRDDGSVTAFDNRTVEADDGSVLPAWLYWNRGEHPRGSAL